MYEVGDIVKIVKKGILYYQAGKIKQINEGAELKYKVETEKKCIQRRILLLENSINKFLCLKTEINDKLADAINIIKFH